MLTPLIYFDSELGQHRIVFLACFHISTPWKTNSKLTPLTPKKKLQTIQSEETASASIPMDHWSLTLSIAHT
jgi:hypothetical protein